MTDSHDLSIRLNDLAMVRADDPEEWKEYQAVLHLYWSGHSDAAIRRLSEHLAERPFHTYAMPLYRLWIELLITKEDYESLMALDQHFLLLSSCSDQVMSFRALRGMLHLFLDNLEACKLIRMSIGTFNKCNYCIEFIQYYDYRVLSWKRDLPVSLFKNGDALSDYFHWNSCCQEFLWKENLLDVEQVIKKMNLVFPSSPDLNVFRVHTCFSQDLFAEAIVELDALLEKFPEYHDYSFMKAYALTHIKGYAEALKLLHDLEKNESYNHDPDIYVLSAYCYEKMLEQKRSGYDKNVALRYCNQAMNFCVNYGFSPAYISSLKARIINLDMDDSVIHDSSESHHINYWIHFISDDFITSSGWFDKTTSGTISRPFGEKIRSGDLVFFVKEDIFHENTWKLYAVYDVLCDPEYHPFSRWESVLNLLCRFPVAIQVDLIKEHDADRRAFIRKDDIKQYNLLKVDERALLTLKKIIKEESIFFQSHHEIDHLLLKIA